MQTKTKISSPHPASADKPPAVSWTKLCLLCSITHSHSSFNFTRNMFIYNAQSPMSLALFLSVSSSYTFSLFILLCMSCGLYFSIHMLLELNMGNEGERGGGQLNPPPERASASLLPLVHHICISLTNNSDLRQLDALQDQHDIKHKICSLTTNQVGGVTEHQYITNIYP